MDVSLLHASCQPSNGLLPASCEPRHALDLLSRHVQVPRVLGHAACVWYMSRLAGPCCLLPWALAPVTPLGPRPSRSLSPWRHSAPCMQMTSSLFRKRGAPTGAGVGRGPSRMPRQRGACRASEEAGQSGSPVSTAKRSFGVYFVTLIGSVGCVGMPMAARTFSGCRNGTARIDRLSRHHVWRPRPIQSSAQWPPFTSASFRLVCVTNFLVARGMARRRRPRTRAARSAGPFAAPPRWQWRRPGGYRARPGTPRRLASFCAQPWTMTIAKAQPYFRRDLARSAIHPTCNWTVHKH